MNDQTELALRYHDGTKHPGGSLMDRFHAFDPAHQPRLHKTYLSVDTVPLSLNEQRLHAPALEAIAEAGPPEGTAGTGCVTATSVATWLTLAEADEAWPKRRSPSFIPTWSGATP